VPLIVAELSSQFKPISPNQASPHEAHGAALARAARKESSLDCILDRDCRSNPMATILSWRCQPLVTRIVNI
jgi:hypothetical protein